MAMTFVEACNKLGVNPQPPEIKRALDVRLLAPCQLCLSVGIHGDGLISVHPEPDKLGLVHPACYIANLGEETLLSLCDRELARVRVCDVPWRTMRKLLDIHAEKRPRVSPFEAKLLRHLGNVERIDCYGGRYVNAARTRLNRKGLIKADFRTGETDMLTPAGRRWVINDRARKAGRR